MADPKPDEKFEGLLQKLRGALEDTERLRGRNAGDAKDMRELRDKLASAIHDYKEVVALHFEEQQRIANIPCSVCKSSLQV
jgi:uncharacterized coiled-coil DUF342 family protein